MILKRWDMRFLEMAQLVASWSKDPSTKVGATIVDDDRRVISVGYNGFPKGVADNKRLEDRDEKYKMIVHAERNALLFSNTSVKNCNKRWQEDFEISRKMFEEAEVHVIEYDVSP